MTLPGEGVAFTVERHADREAWLEARRRGIGGSDAPALWGCGFDSPMGVYADKRALRSDSDAEWLEIGALLEPAIRALYVRRTARAVDYPGEHVILRSLRWPFLSVSIDGAVADEVRDGRGLLEIKNRGGFARWDDGVPLAVQVQAQHGLAVTGWAWASCCALLGGNRFAWADAERDQAFIDLHIERCRRLWECVEKAEPPEADDTEATATALRAIYGRDNGAIVDLDERAARWTDNWIEAGEEAADAARAGRRYENKLRRAIGAAQSARLPDGRTLTLKTQKNEIRVLRVKGKEK